MSYRILVISHEYPPISGGGSGAIQDLCEALATRGHEVMVLTSALEGQPPRVPNPQAHLQLREFKCGRRRLLNASLGELLRFQFRSLSAAKRAARDHQADFCLANFGIPGGVTAGNLNLRMGLPYFCWLAGHDIPGFADERFSLLVNSPFYRGLLRRTYRRAAAVFPNSLGLAHSLQHSMPEVQAAVLPYGIHLPKQPAGRSEKKSAAPLQIVYTGRLVERKRPQDLIAACALLRDQGIAFHLRMLGDGPLRPMLERNIQDAGLTDQVSLAGFVAADTVARELDRADLFVLCSTAEGMPRAVLEALSWSVPVVMTRVQGSDELIDDGENGLLVAPRQPQQLANAMARILNAPPRRRAMREAAYAKACGFSWESVAEQAEQLFARHLP